MTLPLDIGLLGPVVVRVDGVAVALPSVPQRLVLARLALSPDRLASQSALVDTLWPDGPPGNAIGNLHAYVSRLRRALGAGVISRERGGYRLRIGDDGVDVDRAVRLAADARRVAADRPADAAARFGAALSLWRGEPLADLPDRSAFAPDLARLGAWRRQIETEWLTARLSAGEAAAALPDLEHAAAADPLREDVHVLLATAQHQVGRSADALEVIAAYRRRLADERGLDPSAALTDLVRRLLADDPTLRPTVATAPTLPATTEPAPMVRRVHAPGDRFVGRRDELAAVEAALDGHRAVTVVGPGGVGKTRLVLELLDRRHGSTPVTVVELHEVSRAEDVPVTVATAFGLGAAAGSTPTATTIADVVGAGPALLVVDNCEHLLDAAQRLARDLLGCCPGLRILSTSRKRLAVPGEKVVRLGPLAAEEQVDLFCDRAALIRDDFAATADDRRIAGEICRSIDGLPLAVELAARREAVFGLVELRDRLAAGLDVLDPVRDADRSTAVTATVEWSYRLLDPEARRLFDRLSVCQGFPLDAVGYFVPDSPARAAVLLAELVEASLVVPVPANGGRPRYRLLETMRRIGLDHLDAGEREAAEDMRAAWLADHIARCHVLSCERSAEAVAVFGAELVNLRDVLARLVDAGRWDEAGRIGIQVTYALTDLPDLSVLDQLDQLAGVAGDADPLVAARCRAAAGASAWLKGDGVVAEALLTAALDALPDGDPQRWLVRYFLMVNHMFGGASAAVQDDADAVVRDPDAPPGPAATAACCAALTHLFTGDRAAAERRMADHAGLIGSIEDRDGFVGYTRGEIAATADPQAALAHFETAYRLAKAQGRRYIRELAVIGRTAVLVRLGRRTAAARSATEALESLRHSGMWPQLWVTLRLTAELLVDLGEATAPATLLAAAETDPLAPAVLGPEQERHASLWSAIAARLTPEELAQARSAGVRTDRATAVDLALAALGPHRP